MGDVKSKLIYQSAPSLQNATLNIQIEINLPNSLPTPTESVHGKMGIFKRFFQLYGLIPNGSWICMTKLMQAFCQEPNAWSSKLGQGGQTLKTSYMW